MVNFIYHRIKISLAAIVAFGALALTVSLPAQTVILDQIGASSANISTYVAASQYFEPAYSAYNIGAGDDFTAPASLLSITSVQAVVGGYDGYTSYTGVTGWQVNIYSTQAAAGVNLIGNVASVNLTPAQVTANTAFSSATETLITLPVGIVLPAAGKYFLTVIPTNAYATNGVAGIFSALSTTGGTNAFVANPNGGFGFGPTLTISPATDHAYRVYAVPEPSGYIIAGAGALVLGVSLRRRFV